MSIDYDIVVAGPMADWALLTTGLGQVILSTNGNAWPCSELARVAPMFAGRPVFYNHTSGKYRTRLLLKKQNARVGYLARAWWNEEARQIRATLVVTSEHWQDVFSQDKERWRYGFSMDVDAATKFVRGMDFVTKVTRVYTVDCTRWPACGGKFVDAPALDEEVAQEALWNFERATAKNTDALVRRTRTRT